MKIHPRHEQVNRAKVELGSQLSEISERHDLTYGEIMMILSEELASQSKGMIRAEREKPKRNGKILGKE